MVPQSTKKTKRVCVLWLEGVGWGGGGGGGWGVGGGGIARLHLNTYHFSTIHVIPCPPHSKIMHPSLEVIT